MRLFMIALFASVAARHALAQGTISAQGFGFPPGQLSTQALSTGGALGEVDPLSPINPAALGRWGRAGLYFQYDPEFRRVSVSGETDRTTTARFPLVAAAVPVGSRVIVALSSSTLLDRTWGTSFQSGQRLGADSIEFTERFRSNGAINDVRLGGSFTVSRAVAVGVGLHAVTGENRLAVAREFADSLNFGDLDSTYNLAYSGTALSAGVQWRPARALTIGASGRVGGTIRARVGDSIASRATVPGRFGIGARFDGLTGATLAVRADRTTWSDLGELGSSRLQVGDSWDVGVGGEFSGPRVGRTQMGVRAGVRRRTLPFRANGAEVSETSIVTGLGIPLAGGRANLDIGLLHAARSADVPSAATGGAPASTLGVKERAWTLSMGLAVRP